MMPDTQSDAPILSWHQRDLEQRLGFSGGRFTSVNMFLTFLVASLLTVVAYVIFYRFRGHYLTDLFLERGFTQYCTTFLSFWSLAILFLKWRKLRFQRRALTLDFVPADPKYVLSSANADDVLAEMRDQVDDPRRFVLLQRVQIALSNLRNLGRVGDVDEILRSQAEMDESSMETSYALVRGFVWAIPVLGFIGTVQGLSISISGFGQVIGEVQDSTKIVDSLKVVTGGLATAFETTLLALVAALIIQMLLTFLNKAEQEFLDECGEYCQKHIVSRLRVMPFESQLAEYGATS